MLTYFQAMKTLIRCHDDSSDEALDLAIETVGRAEDSSLTQMLIEYLMGEIDGTPKVILLRKLRGFAKLKKLS